MVYYCIIHGNNWCKNVIKIENPIIILCFKVSWCSVTIGMCLEGSWRTNDAGTEYDKNKLSEMSKTLLYIGAIVSAGPAAFIASMQNKLREVLIIGMWFTLGGSILITFSTDALRTLIFGRIFHGIGAGIVCVIVPNYASEFTDSQYRGDLWILLSLNQTSKF